MSNTRFIELSDGMEIDLKRVTHVTGLSGYPTGRRYTAILDSGERIQIYDKPMKDYEKELKVYQGIDTRRHLQRSIFINKWKMALAND